ncbi:MAG: hypothetical protein WAU33_07735 [Candidatus Binataceae bacterium]
MVLSKYLKLSRGPAMLAICLCGGLGSATLAPAHAASAADFTPQLHFRVVQDDSSSNDQSEVPPDQVEKYIAIYKATQANHSLTVEQAAAQQGLTVPQFRTLEGKIERDDALRARVRKALRNSTSKNTEPES